jgi:hypothetical protein
MIEIRDLEVGVVYAHDEDGDDFAFIVTEIQDMDLNRVPFIHVWYRWVRSTKESHLHDRIMDITELPDKTLNYHAQPFTIQEFP